ncbi:DUF2127 domain-containing protein [Candidatus Synechococcus calcipolaris G9]|uniref:DUF2127 domain-containing protein n=1 Tax=Candidatus Synechococcus calcipolaris G9 TaxID=1497997 RepID=A0ABT6EW74_9SYNE|nr:DUF2127 domain-containing protein [Candidatus Synechococcus calcipolaris]MDG2990031.1 DUF2127 domain-containing protein [Candidatus Synechococcus calcipolaris G9]
MKHSWVLKLAIAKKILFALGLLALSGVSAFSWRNYDTVTLWASEHVLTAEFSLVRWGLTLIEQASLPELKLVARVAGLYGALVLVAAAGVWYGRLWAYILLTLLVASLLPLEFRELWQDLTWETSLLVIINLAIFLYFGYETWEISRTSNHISH